MTEGARRHERRARERGESVKIYEVMVLLDTEFSSKNDPAKYVQSLVEKHEGIGIRVERFLDQRLQYEIKNRKRGVYVLAAVRLSPEAVTALTRTFNLDENVLRHIIIDRTGMQVEKFFKRYDAPENHAAELAEARATF